MNGVGFFDLAAPLFDAIDRTLAQTLPDLARVLLYAALAAWLSMVLYKWVSPQRRLRAVQRMTRRVQRSMLADDIEFDELMRRARRSLVLGSRQIWMTLWPTFLTALPLLFLLSWMSNRFDARLPSAGAPFKLCVLPASAGSLLQSSARLSPADDAGCHTLTWPQMLSSEVLSDGQHDLLTLPIEHAIGVIHKRQWWNRLFGNPIGYLPDTSAIDEIQITLPHAELTNFGPQWLRGWLASFLLVMVILSLWLRWHWKLA
jgi:hypothetical protein